MGHSSGQSSLAPPKTATEVVQPGTASDFPLEIGFPGLAWRPVPFQLGSVVQGRLEALRAPVLQGVPSESQSPAAFVGHIFRFGLAQSEIRSLESKPARRE